MMSRPVDHEELKNKIGVWEDNGKIVALATFKLTFGEIFICMDNDYTYLSREIITYAKEHLSKEVQLKVIINDNNKMLQDIATKNGFRLTQKKQNIAILDTSDDMDYVLPNDFKVVSMADDWDFYQYNRVMWRGFNNDGEPSQTYAYVEPVATDPEYRKLV